ncbi:MAG: MFS transporter [Alphaproteobacteria bacterium]|jgi:MHS family proline/betaine transporter-like MFS transporter|nr:MFS transporter [Rickettsiales bacterium]MCE2731669.1 MFS transporter [Rickettsiaceae bacterium]NBY35497.1 MFS transporter [Alphaproteobacteria bacterium]UCM93822.1 MAG: MFS transporter [Candidatus Megaira endosymbiont of Mesostigma viride]HJK88035.1 MFS transporter [Candidatus Megaira endosymbiont of Mesostigma viride]
MNKRRSIFLSAISGNVLEYYDFTVYAVFSLAIGQAFFPSGSQVIQTLSSLSVFAVGFIMRPIGGIIFGFIADKYGRRVSLIISMLGMTMTTFTIGLIPGYSDIGYGAPILLVMMRLIQGLCISGEGAGAAIFILEHYQNLRPGFTAGIVHASNIAGTLLASFVGIILEQLFPELEFAWRFAFILGGIMGIIGFYFRLRVSETPIFEMLAEKKRTLKMPFMHVIRSSWPAMLITCCLGGSASSLVYIIKTYINIFYYEVLGFDKTTALIYLSYSSVIMMLTMPLSGYISDHIGRFKMIIIASITIVIAATPAFMLLASLEIWKQIVALTTIAMLGGFIAGTAYIFIISLFSAEERFTGVAFSYNLGVALFGGTSAVISRWLVEVTHLYHAPAFYVMITSLLFLAMAYSMKKTIIRLIDTNLKPK